MAVVLAFLGSWLILLAGLFTDTHELPRRYPQAVEHPDLTNALQDGTLTLGQIQAAIAACLLLTGPIAICFMVVGGVPALALGVVGVIARLDRQYSTCRSTRKRIPSESDKLTAL